MKNITLITRIIIISIFLVTLKVTSQTVTLKNVQYQGIQIPDCGSIDLNSGSSHNITYNLKVTRPYFTGSAGNDINENGVLKLYVLGNNGEQAEWSLGITGASWTIDIPNNVSYITSFPPVTLFSSQLPINGGWLVAEYSSNNTPYRSCYYDITKPKFKLNPTNVNVACGSTGETFTVSNVNNSPGSLSYEWSVGSGWSYNVNVVSNFTTSTNSVTLVPTTYPLSNVQVIPKLNGVSYPQLTTTVSLSAYNPNVAISGVSQICTTGVLSVNNLPAGSTVTSWHSPNTSIATISSINGYQGLLTKISDGIVNISAIVENSCGQQKTIYKSITVGSPNNLSTIDQFFLIEGDNDVKVETKDGIYDLEWKVNGVLVNDNGNDWVHIYFDNYPCVNNEVILSARRDGICGWSDWLDMTYGECGNFFKFSSNPIKKEKVNGQIIILEKNLTKGSKNYTISIYDNFGNTVYVKTQRSVRFDIKHLKKGVYFVKFESDNGEVETKKLIVN